MGVSDISVQRDGGVQTCENEQAERCDQGGPGDPASVDERGDHQDDDSSEHHSPTPFKLDGLSHRVGQTAKWVVLQIAALGDGGTRARPHSVDWASWRPPRSQLLPAAQSVP